MKSGRDPGVFKVRAVIGRMGIMQGRGAQQAQSCPLLELIFEDTQKFKTDPDGQESWGWKNAAIHISTGASNGPLLVFAQSISKPCGILMIGVDTT